MIEADVLILGAGPGGCATALALLGSGDYRVVLVDKPVRTPFRIGESATPDVAGMLEELGLSADMAGQGHRPYYGTLSLWGGGKPVYDDFLRRGTGHGWHLDRGAFDDHLRNAAVAKGAKLISGATIAAIARDDDGWLINLGGAGIARAKYVVDAAARRSPLASLLGARRHRLDDLVALAVIAPYSPELAGLSLVEPFENGWWYAAPLPNGRSVVALMTDHGIAQSLDFRSSEAYRRAWRETSELQRLVPQPEHLAVASFAAHSGYIDRACGPGWLAVGDALIGFDPLTSSGIAGALSDALAAAATLRSWLNGVDPAEAGQSYGRRADATVARYLSQRRERYGWERRWPENAFWSARF